MARWLRFAISFVALAAVAFQGQATVVGASGSSQIKPEPLTLEETIDLSVADIQAYWAKQFPASFKGRRYEPIAPERIFPYDTSTGSPACYSDAPDPYEPNAFFCPPRDTVAYDIEGLFPDFYHDFGNFSVSMILAHEWGHAIQERSVGFERLMSQGVPTVVTETQADCYAGAWTRRIDDKKSKRLVLEPGDLDVALAGLLRMRDQVGTEPYSPGAHGSAFDRINAFQLGFDNGAGRCAKFLEGDPPKFVEIPFSDLEEAETGGDLPLDELIPLVTSDLDAYWATRIENYKPISAVVPYDVETSRLPTCGDEAPDPAEFEGTIFYCEIGDFVAWDNQLLADTHEQYGDFAVATLIANRWSNAVHTRLKSKAKGKAETLEGDCLTGSWAGSLVKQTRRPELSLSPGDLDESMQSLLKFNSSTGKGLSGFKRAGAFRKGFSDGASACVKPTKKGK
jgi:predicted metalloprotease